MSATLTPSFSSVDDATNWAIDWLRQNGFTITKGEQRLPESPKQLCARLGLAVSSFSRMLSRGDNPSVECSYTPSGRLRWLRTTPEFDAWVQRNRARYGRPRK